MPGSGGMGVRRRGASRPMPPQGIGLFHFTEAGAANGKTLAIEKFMPPCGEEPAGKTT